MTAEPPPAEAPPTAESILAPTLSFRGEVTFEDAVRIEGEIQGKITGQGKVTVCAGGRVIGDIAAAEGVIHGTVQGNISAAGRLELASTAQVVGDIQTSRLCVADGARMTGKVEVGSESLSMPAGGQPAAEAPAEAPAEADHLEKVL